MYLFYLLLPAIPVLPHFHFNLASGPRKRIMGRRWRQRDVQLQRPVIERQPESSQLHCPLLRQAKNTPYYEAVVTSGSFCF